MRVRALHLYFLLALMLTHGCMGSNEHTSQRDHLLFSRVHIPNINSAVQGAADEGMIAVQKSYRYRLTHSHVLLERKKRLQLHATLDFEELKTGEHVRDCEDATIPSQTRIGATKQCQYNIMVVDAISYMCPGRGVLPMRVQVLPSKALSKFV